MVKTVKCLKTDKMLEKVWGIDLESAKCTINFITHLNRQAGANGSLSRNFGTNDRMLHYKRIKSFFFTDMFFVTKKAKSSRGYTCMQLFVSDKGFLFVVPMKSVSEFPSALKMFPKEVGVPDYLITDSQKVHKSNEVKQFCHKIGTALRLLEE